MSITGSEQWMYNAGGGFYPYPIDQSLRFSDNDAPRLNGSLGTPTDARKGTISVWIKRSDLPSANRYIMSSYDGSSSASSDVYFDTSHRLQVSFGGSSASPLVTNQVFRDVSAWFHLCIVLDSTQGTSSNRNKIYINGERVTSFSSASYPSLNQSHMFSASGTRHRISTNWNSTGTLWFDGYMAEFHFVDGQALDPTDFGEFKSGIWIAKEYAGTYGNSGWYLDFANSADIGNDVSGNNNDWTPVNLTASDVVLDSPTNNFTTFPKNVLKSSGYTQHLEGNLQLYQPSWGGWDIRIASSTMPASGKYYWEVYPAQGNFPAGQGGFTLQFDNIRGNENMSGFPQFGAPMAYFYGGVMSDYRVNPGWVSYTRSGSFAYTVNSTVLQVAVDCDNNKIWYGINNSWMGVSGTTVTAGTGNPATGANGQAILGDVTDYVFGTQCADQSSACRLGINFGQDSTFAGYKTAGGNTDENGYGDFQYAPPSGFVALCSQNMPAPAIDPANDETPEDYFNTLLYTGNGANGRALTGVGFQPDWTWIKSRSASRDHKITDSVRGVNKEIGTQSFGVEVTRTNGLSVFGSDGFTVGSESGYNNSGDTFVAWNWKAGGTAVSNTDGDITSQVSANVDSGFSIVTYSGNSTGSQTVGHGLGRALDCVIVKARTGGNGNWGFSHAAYADTSLLTLDTSQALSTGAGTRLQRTTSTSTFLVGDSADFTITNASGWTYVAYCFHEVEGYSKFGSYVGNGSADGVFVYTGHKPSFVMVKRTDSGGEWVMWDNRRSGYNVDNDFLYPNTNNSEYNGSTYVRLDLTSNGFKMRDNSADTNGSGASYIFLSIAEQPFKYANAR